MFLKYVVGLNANFWIWTALTVPIAVTAVTAVTVQDDGIEAIE